MKLPVENLKNSDITYWGGLRANTRVLPQNGHNWQEQNREEERKKNTDLTRFANCLCPLGRRGEKSY